MIYRIMVYSEQEVKMINELLLKYVPLFLEQHCTIHKKNFMDPLQFWIALQSFLKANKITIPSSLYLVNSDWVKYYFHQLDISKPIYVTGSPRCNVLVGVSVQTWPGTIETDGCVQREDELQKIAEVKK